MIYIKSFNEDITSFNFKEELKDFCEMNLAYLLDEGGEVEIAESHEGNYIRVSFNENKTWYQIKDHIIPFLTRLKNKYSKQKTLPNGYPSIYIRIYFLGAISINPKIEDVINDDPQIFSNLEKHSGITTPTITDMSIFLSNYKQPTKILTKIKSFFK